MQALSDQFKKCNECRVFLFQPGANEALQGLSSRLTNASEFII